MRLNSSYHVTVKFGFLSACSLHFDRLMRPNDPACPSLLSLPPPIRAKVARVTLFQGARTASARASCAFVSALRICVSHTPSTLTLGRSTSRLEQPHCASYTLSWSSALASSSQSSWRSCIAGAVRAGTDSGAIGRQHNTNTCLCRSLRSVSPYVSSNLTSSSVSLSMSTQRGGPRYEQPSSARPMSIFRAASHWTALYSIG